LLFGVRTGLRFSFRHRILILTSSRHQTHLVDDILTQQPFPPNDHPTHKTRLSSDRLSRFTTTPSCCTRKGGPPRPQLNNFLFDFSHGLSQPTYFFDNGIATTFSEPRSRNRSMGAGAFPNSLPREKGEERKRRRE